MSAFIPRVRHAQEEVIFSGDDLGEKGRRWGGVARRLQMCLAIIGVHKATRFPNDSKKAGSICASHSLLVGSWPGGDGAGGEADAVQMSPGLPPVPTRAVYIQLEQSDQSRGQKHTPWQSRTKSHAARKKMRKPERISKGL